MSKKYDLGKNSDMRRFEKDLKKQAVDMARESAKKQSFDTECPNCGKSINVNVGKNVCPHCGETVNVEINF